MSYRLYTKPERNAPGKCYSHFITIVNYFDITFVFYNRFIKKYIYNIYDVFHKKHTYLLYVI